MVTNPEAGVIVTNPATSPRWRPARWVCRLRNHSAPIQLRCGSRSGEVRGDKGAGRQSCRRTARCPR